MTLFRSTILFGLLLSLAACNTGLDEGVSDSGPDALAEDGGDEGQGDEGLGDEGSSCLVEPCVVVGEFPFEDTASTLDSELRQFDGYACAPTVGENGPEVVYLLQLSEPGTLVAMLEGDGQDGVDVDVHLLDDLSVEACLRRGHIGLSHHVAAGTYYLIVDSWSDASGTSHEGPYHLHLHFLPDSGLCAMSGEAIERIGEDGPYLMPATGPVVLEAHLVTAEEFTDDSWPQSFTDGIAAHYQLSQQRSGYLMDRSEPWCPCCEPANEYGQGSSVRPPVEAETFYLNMRWAKAPARGERYLVYNGLTGRAVVAAAGYENGPGDLSRIGGSSEEIHHHLGTGHLSVLTFAVAADQTLPYGPIDCGVP